MWRTQVPFLLVMTVIVVGGLLTRAAPAHLLLMAAGVSLLSFAVTLVWWPRGGDACLITSAVLHMVAVGWLDYASPEVTPSVAGLMILPALHLTYGFRGRWLPYVLAVSLPPLFTFTALIVSGAGASILQSAGFQCLILVVVASMVFGSSRQSWLKRAALEVALRQARGAINTAQVVADAIGTGVTFYDEQGRVQIRNKAMLEVISHAGSGPEDSAASHVYRSDRHTPLPAHDQPLQRLMRGEAVDGDLLYVGPPGNQRALTFVGTRLSGDDGPAGWVVTSQDVADLVNAVNAREEMILTFAHELRTPLTSIIGFAETLQDTADLEALGLARPVDVIHRNATHLSTLVQALVQASTQVDKPLSLTRGSMETVARETIASFTSKAADRDIRVLLVTQVSDTTASFDRVGLRQALENLLSNALKYSLPGGVTRIVLGGTDDEVTAAVVDDGPGIEPQDLPQLFQRGFRSVSARRTATQGMGLGLAIARDIARAHGGDITVTSTPGHGATFTLQLPRHQEPGVAIGQQQAVPV